MKTVNYAERAYTPSKIVCVGRNYAAHAAEMGSEVQEQAVLFCKPNSAIGDMLCATHGEALHYEAELSFLVEGGRFVAVALGLDLTKRALQRDLKQKQLPWERAKAFNGSALFSPFVALPEQYADLEFRFFADQNLLQHGCCRDMVFSPEQVLAEIAGFMSLEDGDVVMTGTPAGVGPLKAGCRYRGELQLGGKALVKAEWPCVAGV